MLFRSNYMRMEDLVHNGTLSENGAKLLRMLVRCGYNIFVSGGTSSGKTTLLNALAEAIPREERVIVAEDSAELKMHYIDNIVHMECRNSNSAVQAMNTGHNGSLSTGHANSAEGMLRRLEALYLAAMPISTEAIRQQIAEGLDILVHIEKREDGQRRIMEITELQGYADGKFNLNRLMAIDQKGVLSFTGSLLANTKKAEQKGENYADLLYEA